MKWLGAFDISEKGLRRLRRDLGIAVIPIILGVSTLIVGGISWGLFVADPSNITTQTKHSDTTGLFHRIVYGALRTVSDFAPSVWNVNEGNYGTDAAAILGAGAFYASVFLIAANVMSETVRRLAARYVYAGHVVIIGETPLASNLAEVWRRRVPQIVQVVARKSTRPPRGSAQVRSPMDGRIFARFGLDRAASIFIDLGDDMATLALAFDLLAAANAAGGSTRVGKIRADWTLVVRERTFADHFAGSLVAVTRTSPTGTSGAALPTIRYFSPERAVVRRFLAGRPLFLDVGARDGIHALVVGSGAAVDELIQAIFQTALVAGRPWPRVSVLSADPAADRSAFLSARPGVIDAIDLAFLPLKALDDFEPAVRVAAEPSTAQWDTRLLDRDAAAPVNVLFLMADHPDANSRLAIKLKSIQKKTGRLRGHVFGCSTSIAGDTAGPGPDAFGRTIEGYETFALDEDFLDEEICGATRRQTLALALHENYRSASGDPAVPGWDGLPESLRRANGNAADHCLAKLHMLGFDVAGLPPGAIPRLAQADDRRLRAELRAEPLTGRARDVVFLEHDRWGLERRFDGWVFGKVRDNAKQIHPLLVPWDELSREEQDKDRDQIEALLTCLRSEGDPAHELRRVETPEAAGSV